MSVAQAALADTSFWPYLAAAAVLTDFAADKLRPMGGGDPDIVRVGAMLLEHGEPIRAGPAKGRWSLSGRSRASVLSELKRRGSLQDAAKANFGSDHPDNPTQRAIDEMISNAAFVPIQQSASLSDLLGYERAVDLLGSAIETPPEVRSKLIALIERLHLLEPLRRLIEHGFAGRENELKVLRTYVDELESKSFMEMLSRKLDNVIDLFRERPPLVIWGPGGAGKSTLIAKFLVDHAGPQQTKPTPFVYLDFDSGRLDPMQPDTLLAEALRQVQVQFPDFAAKAANLAADAETRLASEDGANITRSAQLQQSSQLRSRFADLMREIGKANDSKVLLFIDTFEVVQRRGITPVFNVIRLAAQIVQATPRVRPVIAGRVPIREEDFKFFTKNPPKWQPLPLAGFDAAAGRLFLRARLKALGVATVAIETLDRIVAIAGGNPLSLRLAAQVFKSKGLRGLEDAAADAKFQAELSQERLQGFLHNRIIAALEPPLDRLADPGLVVRRMSPEVIFRVLAGPCHLELEKLEDAQQLFRKLEPEVSLFEPTGVDTLRHRSDVRLLMLPILRARLKDEARAIDEAAVEYWSGKDDADARAEQIYHLIWLEREISELDAVYTRGDVSRLLLEDALDEFEALDRSAEARVWLYTKLDRDISSELESKAGLAEWERHTARRARSLLQSGAAFEALIALRGRPDRSPASALWLLEVQALKLLGRDKEALQLVDRALDRARVGGAPSHVLQLLLEKAWLFERAKDVKGAFGCASQATELARSLKDDALIFEAMILLTRSARLSRSEQTESLRDELAKLLDIEEVTNLLASQPTLIGEAIAEIGDLRPELFIMASDRRSLGGSDASGEAATFIAAGVAYAERGDLDAAVEALERARDVSYRVEDITVRARVLFNLATVYYQQGRLEQAAARVEEVRVLGDQHQNEELQLMAWDVLGRVRAAGGQYRHAIGDFERSLAIARSANNLRHQASTLGHLAEAHVELGEPEKALRCAEESVSIAHELGDVANERRVQITMAIALWRLGRIDRASEVLERSFASAESAGDTAHQIAIFNALAALWAESNEWKRAEECLRKALNIAQQGENAAAAIPTLQNLGRLYVQTGRLPEALQAHQTQLAIATRLKDEAAITAARDSLALVQKSQRGDDEASPRHVLDNAFQQFEQVENFKLDVSNARSAELSRSMGAAQSSTEELIHQTLKKL